jgi:hypothetical protein
VNSNAPRNGGGGALAIRMPGDYSGITLGNVTGCTFVFCACIGFVACGVVWCRVVSCGVVSIRSVLIVWCGL